MCYGRRRGPLPNNTSCHLIAKLRKVIIILKGPTGRSPGSPTGQSAPDRAYRLVVMHRLAPNFAEAKVFYSYISFGLRVIISLTFPLQV